MLANVALVAFFIVNAYALIPSEELIKSLDDALGEKYVAQEDLKKASQEFSNLGFNYGRDWILMPDGNGIPRVAILKLTDDNGVSRVAEDERFSAVAAPPEEVVHLTLYTQENREGTEINTEDFDSLKFDGTKPTKIVIHGWQSSADSDTVTSIRDAYLDRFDVNVITVDWSDPAGKIFYPSSAAYTTEVGRHVAGIIDELAASKGGSYEDIHIIGHSLGAHCAGAAGSRTKEKVSRITGLDPARPGFHDILQVANRLDESDARFVEVIHSCSGILGLSRPVGHADFYPNGGTPFQPGCCCLNELISVCSHGRSHKYFSESILSKSSFEAVKCDGWEKFKGNSCDNSTRTPMGEYTPSEARGTFYLRTNSEPPFGLGLDGITFV